MRFFVIVFVFLFALGALAATPRLVFANHPFADANGPYTGAVGIPVQFDGSRSFDNEGNPLTYSWDFGDGSSPGSGVDPEHTYTAPGKYTVTLVVNDGIADSAPFNTTATISLPPPSDANLVPENGASAISLPLELDWEPVPLAESYYYEIINITQETLVTDSRSNAFSQEILDLLAPRQPFEWYQDECATQQGHECNNIETREFIAQQQIHEWRVKACENADGTGCGAFNDPVWIFTYLLAPPDFSSLSPSQGNEARIPVTLDWEDVPEAQSYYVTSPECLPWLVDEDENCFELPYFPGEDVPPPSEHTDDICFFTKAVSLYHWRVASCFDKNASFCGPNSEQAQFSTSPFPHPDFDPEPDPPFDSLPAPDALKPLVQDGKIPGASKETVLSWNGSVCAYAYEITLVRQEDGQTTTFFTTDVIDPETLQAENVSLGNEGIGEVREFWENSDNLDKVFSWTTTPCWSDQPGQVGIPNCTDQPQSNPSQFRTAGAAPEPLSPGVPVQKQSSPQTPAPQSAQQQQSFTKIPINLSWTEKDGAASYKYQLAKNAAFTDPIEDTSRSPSAQVEYNPPDIDFEIQYWWRVATCVDVEGEVCGKWSKGFTFKTHALKAPKNPLKPQDKGEAFLPGSLSWEPDLGASYYQYQVNYQTVAPDETLEGCAEKQGTQLFQPPFPITSRASFFFTERCAGDYLWTVRSCIDKDCAVATDWPESSLWTFTAKEAPVQEPFSLVPCGRNTNIEATPYNEKEACEIKHVGFLLQNILDFVLWKLSLLVLAVLAVLAGASTYFSLGSPDVATRVRSLFRSYFYGVLILVFAWAIVNVVLGVFGFDIEFFGRWYELPF